MPFLGSDGSEKLLKGLLQVSQTSRARLTRYMSLGWMRPALTGSTRCKYWKAHCLPSVSIRRAIDSRMASSLGGASLSP